jgi:hypothetical protein
VTALRRTVAQLCTLLALSLPAFAQDLLPWPDLAPEIAALPRLAGDSDLARTVNAALDALDARDLEAVNCHYSNRSDGPFRAVEVLSDGPEFISFFITKGTYCDGAAHPWTAQEIVNFDLESGLQTDLRDLLPDTFQSADDQSEMLSVLFLTHVADLPGECVWAYAHAYAMRNSYLSFDLGLAESRGALMLWPQGLAFVHTPCLDAAFVSAERLGEAGFDSRLIKALTPSP